jgi:magnesium transporter
MELGRLIGPELRELLRDEPDQVKDLVEDFHPQDVSECLEELDDQLLVRALKAFPIEYGSQIFERLEEDRQLSIARLLGLDKTARLVSQMDADDVVDFFGLLPEETRTKLLSRLQTFDPEVALDIEELTRWPEDTAGGLMNNWFVEVSERATIDSTLQELRAQAAEGVEVLGVVYVVSADGRVVGFVTLRQLLMSPPNRSVVEVMNGNLVSVRPDMPQEEVARTFARYDFQALPVVDEAQKLLGVITPDDVIDVVAEEADLDAQKMAAVAPLGDPYFAVPFWMYFRKRAPWLLVLFVGGFFTTTTMEAFGPVLRAMTHLAFYVPLLISAGGNSGSQSATMIIRGLAVGEIQIGDWWKVALREAGQGLLLGAMLAMTGVLRALLGGDGLDMASLVGTTIVAIVTMGCLVGSMMPLLLHRLGVDPATSSTPFVASVVDVVGIVVYLGLARLLLAGLDASLSGAGG